MLQTETENDTLILKKGLGFHPTATKVNKIFQERF